MMRAGLFLGGGRLAGRMMADKIGGQGMKNQTQARRPQEEPQPRRGLIGGARSMLGNVGGFLQNENGGVSNLDRIGLAAAMMRDDPSFALAAQQGIDRQQSTYQQRQQEMQEAQGQRNTQEKQAEQERQRLDGQARALGMDSREFSMLPPEVQSDLFARQYTPEEPDRPSAVREYEYALQQGFRGSFQDWRTQNPSGTNVNVNMPGQPQIGSIPPGYEAVRDPETGNFRMQLIPGGPAAAEAEEAALSREQRDALQARNTAVVHDEIGRTLSLLTKNPRMFGRASVVTGIDPEGPVAEAGRLYDTIGSFITRDTLQQMREASSTGGALGNVSDAENAMLRAAYGSFDPSAPIETQVYNLVRLNNLLMDVVHGPGQGGERLDYEQTLSRINGRSGTEDAGQGGAEGAGDGASSRYADGTIIENDNGVRMIRRSGRWEPL